MQLVVDIGDTESSYRYPHIVLSCDDEDRSAAYSSVYGRLLVDRCVTDGLLIEESPNVYVPKEEVEKAVKAGVIKLYDGMMTDDPKAWEEREGELWLQVGEGMSEDGWVKLSDGNEYLTFVTTRYVKLK